MPPARPTNTKSKGQRSISDFFSSVPGPATSIHKKRSTGTSSSSASKLKPVAAEGRPMRDRMSLQRESVHRRLKRAQSHGMQRINETSTILKKAPEIILSHPPTSRSRVSSPTPHPAPDVQPADNPRRTYAQRRTPTMRKDVETNKPPPTSTTPSSVAPPADVGTTYVPKPHSESATRSAKLSAHKHQPALTTDITLPDIKTSSVNKQSDKHENMNSRTTPQAVTDRSSAKTAKTVDTQPKPATKVIVDPVPEPLKKADSASDKSTSDSDLSDDDDDKLFANASFIRRTLRAAKQPDRFRPDAATGTGTAASARAQRNVFSSRDDIGGGSSSDVRRLLRQVEQAERQEAELQKIRGEVQDAEDDLDNEEREMKRAADNVDELSAREAATNLKYYEPLPLFSSAIAIHPVIPADVRSTNQPTCVVHDMLSDMYCDANVECKHVYADVIGTFLKDVHSKPNFRIQPASLDLIQRACLFDDTRDKYGIDTLFDGLCAVVPTVKAGKSSMRAFTPLCTVLKAYGAVFPSESSEKQDVTMADVQPGTVTLDHAVLKPHDQRSPDEQRLIDISLRNIGRTLRLAAAQIAAGWPVHKVLGRPNLKACGPVEQVAAIVTLCTQLLLNVVGARLHADVGALLSAALCYIDSACWPAARARLALSMAGTTDRLHLQAELVTYLLPLGCKRALQLGTDTAFLALLQWCAGPAKNPTPTALPTEFTPTDDGCDDVSFTLGDLVAAAEDVPDVDKDSDVAWVAGVARLLKHIVSLPVVLRMRQRGQLRRLYGTMQRLRHGCCRFRVSVEVQESRMALDVAMRSVQQMCVDFASLSEVDVVTSRARQATMMQVTS